MRTLTDPIPEAEFSLGLTNFSAVCQEQSAALGLDAGDLTAIADAAESLASDLNAVAAARAALQAAISAKDARKASARALVSRYSQRFRADQEVPDELLVRLMLSPHRTAPTNLAPTIPTDLTASADGDGAIRLRWSRGENHEATIFVIESRGDPADAWVILGATTRRTFHTTSPPGRYVAYRISAQRRGVSSLPSTPVVLWDAVGASSLADAA